jgi:hypothetical protein
MIPFLFGYIDHLTAALIQGKSKLFALLLQFATKDILLLLVPRYQQQAGKHQAARTSIA